MEKYVTSLKELMSNFSYHQFVDLTKELDNEIMSGNILHLGSEFIYYFNQIISMINDGYLVDNKPGTLGHMLVENALLNKEKITPTLAICFFLEQKRKIGLNDVCNEVNFRNSKSDFGRMMITYSDNKHSKFSINWLKYLESKEEVDEYNYDVMWDILHEITHIYQLTRTEQDKTPFDKLTYYDFQKDSLLTKNGLRIDNMLVHQALLSEFMADEQANVFMLQLARNYPEYFNDVLIQKEQDSYRIRKDGTYGNYGANPREAFAELISDIRKTYEKYPNEPAVTYIKPMLDEIEILNQKSQPLIVQLQAQGISEKAEDSYYSIFLKTRYQFDGENIILNNDSQKASERI